MRARDYAVVGVLAGVMLVGCRTRMATRVTEIPRADLDLSTGNRGYLAGTPPSPGEQETTRQMMQTDIEIPTFYKPQPGAASVGLDDIAPPETDLGEPPAEPAGEAVAPGPQRWDTYVVQRGDSLWSIAAKPEIYGKGTRWRELLEANRELLHGSPDRIRSGITLRIPRGGAAGDSGDSYEDEGVTFKK